MSATTSTGSSTGSSTEPRGLEALVAAARASFPDVDYLTPGGVLTVRTELRAVERLRLELPANQFLHFQSLAVHALGVTDLPAMTRLSASSWYGKYAEKFDLRAMLDFDHPRGTTVHTQADAPAWVELSFAQPVDITEIRLRNVAGTTAGRATGLRISAVGRRRRSAVVYDAAAREEQLVQSIAGAVAYAPSDEGLALALAPAIARTMYGRYEAARTAFDDLELPEDTRQRFRNLMSRTVLAGRELEWTIHGPQRCFRFWNEREKVRYLEDAVALTRDLRTLTPNVCFGFGAALAVVRDGDFIPHDDDIDVIVGFEEHEAASLREARELMATHLRARGYAVGGPFIAHRHVSRDGRKPFDVFVGLFEGESISWYPGVRGALDRSTMYPTSEAPFLGVTVPLPRNPLVYLERIYGPGWRHPDPGFKHTWDRAPYEDLVRRPAKA